jgi:hypothetical protein
VAPHKPLRQKKRRKKRWRSAGEIEAAEITKIRRAMKRAGSNEKFDRWVELARQQLTRKVGRPAEWRDDRLLFHLEWFYRHRPRSPTKTRYELTREFVKALWEPELKHTAISKQAITVRLYRKWNESGYGKLPAEKLSDAHVRLAMGRIPFGADPPSLNNYRWIWSLPSGRTAAFLTEPEKYFQREAERKAERLPGGGAE